MDNVMLLMSNDYLVNEYKKDMLKRLEDAEEHATSTHMIQYYRGKVREINAEIKARGL